MKKWLEVLQQTLQQKSGVQQPTGIYSLHELLVPFVNLSIPNKNKSALGGVLIDICFQVLHLSDDEQNFYIYSRLEDTKQNASKVNLFFI